MGFFKKKKIREQTDLLSENPDEREKISNLGKNLNVKGTISGDDDIQIFGVFEGKLKIKGDLGINKSARINGTAEAKSVYVKGDVDGELTAGNKIILDQTAKMKGKISTPVITLVEGAQFNGEVKMGN